MRTLTISAAKTRNQKQAKTNVRASPSPAGVGPVTGEPQRLQSTLPQVPSSIPAEAPAGGSPPRSHRLTWDPLLPLQRKLAIGSTSDPLEAEAESAADRVLRGVPAHLTQTGGPVLRRKCACEGSAKPCESCQNDKKKKLMRRADGAVAPTEAPSIVHDVISLSGQPLDSGARAYFESRFGRDFSDVRIHTDPLAARSAQAVNALAYTVGQEIVFAPGRYAPTTPQGRHLLAHELAHVLQQGSATPLAATTLPISHPADPAERAADVAADSVMAGIPTAPAPTSSPVVARQIPGREEREPDPGCTPDKPYRIAPKSPSGPADYAVVPACSATPIPSTPSRTNPLAPDTSGGGTQPTQPQPTPPVTQPTQPTQQPGQTTQPTQPAPPPATGGQQQPAAEKKTGDKDDFSDDPLADYDDPQSIRVRPGPVRTTLIRPRPAAVKPPITDCGSLFEIQTIAQFGGKKFGPWDGAAVAKTADATFKACPLAYVSVNVREKPSSDDPHGEAVERAMSLEHDLMDRIGADKYTPDHYYSGSMSSVPGSQKDPDESEIEVDLGSQGKVSPGTGGGRVTPTPPPPATTQISGQVGFGGVKHLYTTPFGPNTPPSEWVLQVQGAVTKQRHAKNQSGREDQLFVQASYSVTTKQWTVAVGGQVAQVFQLSDTLQASLFGQLQFGQNINAAQAQAAAAAGTQIQWQPVEWFAIVGQATGGPVSQPGGPSSVDLGFTISIQIMK
ncbi:MAG: DUF4157 domain-containing protein [Terracidiphilus sp.]